MSIPKKQHKPVVYEPSFKIAIAREYLTSTLGYGGMAKKYNLRNGDVVKTFVRWYKEKYVEGIKDSTITSEPDMISPGKEVKELQLKVTALEMLIENAGKELGMDLVKKFGTKQSGK